MSIRITGTLLAEAEARTTTGAHPRALVFVTLGTPQGLPYTATQDLGSGFAAHLAAATKARRLHKGRPCTVVCEGLRIRTDHGLAQLQCLSVGDITAPLAESRCHAD
jgi:hypothetical protein